MEGDELACSFEYDCELFDQPMMARMAKHFRRILEAVVAAPERSISRIGLLENDEWQRAVLGWNSTAREYPHARWQRPLQRFRPNGRAMWRSSPTVSRSALASLLSAPGRLQQSCAAVPSAPRGRSRFSCPAPSKPSQPCWAASSPGCPGSL